MFDSERTLVSHIELQLRCELSGARGEISGMKYVIEILMDELRRVTNERNALAAKARRKKK